MFQQGDLQKAQAKAMNLLNGAKQKYVELARMDEHELFKRVTGDPRTFDTLLQQYDPAKIQAWVEKHAAMDVK